MEKNEIPVEAAQRELKEELGIDAPKERLKLFKTYSDPDRIRHVFYMIDDEEINYTLHEGDDIKRVSFSEVKNLNVNPLAFKVLSDFLDTHR